jgi:hypothetical protein
VRFLEQGETAINQVIEMSGRLDKMAGFSCENRKLLLLKGLQMAEKKTRHSSCGEG